MGRDKETAEERLLRMIEGPQPQMAAGTPGRGGPGFFNLKLGGLGSIFTRPKPLSGREDPVVRHLRLISHGLWIVLLAIGGYVVFAMTRPQKRLPAFTPPSAQGPAATPASVGADPLNQLSHPLGSYVDSVMQRNPFTGGADLPEQPVQAPVQSARERLEAITSKLTIVGIDRGTVPEALIEDTSQGRTYFVKVRDKINGLDVSDINTRGVVVRYEGEELLLH